jgi:hypothetical protein
MPSPDSVKGLRSSRKPAAPKRGSRRRRRRSRQALQNSSSNEKRRHYHRNEKHRSTHWKQKKRFHINHLQRQRVRTSQFLKEEIDPNEEKFLATVARIRNPKTHEMQNPARSWNRKTHQPKKAAWDSDLTKGGKHLQFECDTRGRVKYTSHPDG